MTRPSSPGPARPIPPRSAEEIEACRETFMRVHAALTFFIEREFGPQETESRDTPTGGHLLRTTGDEVATPKDWRGDVI